MGGSAGLAEVGDLPAGGGEALHALYRWCLGQVLAWCRGSPDPLGWAGGDCRPQGGQSPCRPPPALAHRAGRGGADGHCEVPAVGAPWTPGQAGASQGHHSSAHCRA